MPKQYVDLAIIVPLREEFHRLQAAFKTTSEGVDGTLFSVELESTAPGILIAAILQDDAGKAAATRATDALIAKYDIGIIAVVGIAGGVSNDASIGDVCFTGTIIDLLENIKVTGDDKDSQSLEFNSSFYPTDSLLTFALRYTQLGSDIRPQFEKWQQDQHAKGVALIPGEFIGRESKNEAIGIPQVHDGSIVCGFVSKSEIYKGELRRSAERKVLALETESGGAFHSAQSARIPVVAIRGICDYADKNKNKLEQQTGGRTRQIAADNAISFLKLQLANPQFRRYLARRRDEVLNKSAPLLDTTEAPDVVILREVRDTIHQQLSQLSPHYHDKPEGYRLPLPRVRRTAATATVSPAVRRNDPVSILEAVSSHRVIVIDVPRNYPDHTLPWLLANELTLVEIDAMQVVPIVISGDLVRPPQGTIASATPIDIEGLDRSGRVRPVVLIVDFPSSLRPRLEFLRSEFEKYPSARFVLINRIGPNVATDTSLVVMTGAEHLALCGISFAEISDFFQRTFHMPDQEAGVAALRMQGMFRQFKLNVHPSYFSGVASELLTALLRANRRTELLQIAVGGFLSFVVAGDQSEVVLSRTTREEFLKKLIFAQRVEKRNFDRVGLVKFVEEFAAEKDFDTEPFEFIRSFQERGIIHFEEDHVAISLAFVESYLLAAELVDRPAEAASYFSVGEEDFDFSTFDVYAEIGASDEVVNIVIAALDRSIEQLGGTDGHILLTDEIHPALVGHQSRLRVIEERLKKAFDDVVYSRPNSAEKQRLLDVAARAEEGAKTAQETARVQNASQDAEMKRLSRPMFIWGAATVLLGSGSERLNKEPKRLLAAKIVTATTLLLDRLMRNFSRVDFGKMKSDIQSEKNIRDIFDLSADDPIPDDCRTFLSAVLDAYEFSLLGYPIRAMFQLLGNAAGQPVLWRSVSSLSPSDTMEDLIARVWATEINAIKGIRALKKAIAKLPAVPFFRYTLSQYFVMREFWNHWEVDKRLALLEAADTAIEPLGQRLNKGSIKRAIISKKREGK